MKIISLFLYVDKFQYPDPSLFIMVRVSGAANFPCIIIIPLASSILLLLAKLFFWAIWSLQLPIYLLSLCAKMATDIHCHYYYGKCKPWNCQYLIKVCLTAAYSGIHWTIIKNYGNVKRIENFQYSK